MSRTRRTRPIDWIVCLALFAVGLFFLAAGEFARRYGTTPESALTVVTGPATDATRSSYRGTEYLRFTVAGQTVDYSSDLRGYARLLDAIAHGEPLTIGVSTRRETLIPRSGWVPLYTLAIGGETLRSYHETVTTGYRSSNAPFLLAAVLLGLGGWGLLSCYRNRNQSAAPPSPQEVAAAWRDPRRVRLAAAVVSGALYAGLLSAVLHPDSMPTSVAVFGERPLGLPLRLFIFLFFSLLFLPVPFASWHGFLILFRNAAEGGGFGKPEIVRAILSTPSVHKDLRRSRRIVVATGIFYLALMAAWIWYADSRGI